MVHASRNGQGHLYAVDLAGASRGWAVGQRGLILATRDGTQWVKQKSRVLESLYSVSFASASVGYAVGDAGRVLKTTNGGATWNRLTWAVRATLTSLDFVDATHGWVAGTVATGADAGPAPVVLRTADGGRTWTPQTLPPAAYPTSVDFLDADAGWIAGQDGRVFATADGGDTWVAEDAGVADGLSAIVVVSPADVWAASLGGGIVHSAR